MPGPSFVAHDPLSDTELGSLLAVDPTEAGAAEEAACGRSSPLAKALHDDRLPPPSGAPSPLERAPSIRDSRVLVRRFFWLLVPSFIQSRIAKEPPKPEKLHPTAYLDGMRGLAAFAVFIHHLTYQTFETNIGFGAERPGDNTLPIQLPIIRLLYSGPPMVAIFFVISGYALSHKPTRLMRARQYASLFDTMSSAVFRRALRLYLPCFASTFAVAVLCQLGAYDATRTQHANMRVSRPDDHAWTAPNPLAQLRHWAAHMFDFVHPWEWMVFGGSTDYDRHLWTIPVEFRASMALFLAQLTTARMRPGVRVAALAALACWAHRWGRWEVLLFLAGAVLAELRLARADDCPRLAHAVFGLALFVASYPEAKAASTPGFRTLAALVPAYVEDPPRFWPCVAAVPLVWAAGRSPALRAVFASPLALYLGKVSFALYLVHGPVIHTVGYAAMVPAYTLTGVQPPWHFQMGFALVAALTVVVTVWAADVFWRAVDEPCVRFARRVEGVFFMRTEQ